MSRVRSLDSLRGVAAAIVVVGHSMLVFPGVLQNLSMQMHNGFGAPYGWLFLTPLRLLMDGPGAVLLFFVLSGFVLALRPAAAGTWSESYFPYLTKRFCRIWLPFALAILLAAALTHAIPLYSVPGTSDWFAASWIHPATTADVADHLSMTEGETWLDNPMWSLVHEMRISIIFPILTIVAMRTLRGALAGTVLLTIAAAAYFRFIAPTGAISDIGSSFVRTSLYIFLFVAGIGIALPTGTALRHRIAGMGKAMTLILWVGALGLVSFPPTIAGMIATPGSLFLLLSSGFGAALIVLLCSVEGTAARLLRRPVPIFLGRVSYSLYLTHVIVINTVVRSAHGLIPLPALLVISVMLSLPVAHLFNRWVEAPSGQLGRWLEERMSGWKSNRATPEG